MLFKKCLLLKLLQLGKHGTVLDIVSVDDGIAILKGSICAGIHKNSTGIIFLFFKGVIQIIGIITSLHDGIGYICIRDQNPADNLRIFLLQCLPVNREILLFRIFGNLGNLLYRILFLPLLIIQIVDADQLIGGKQKNGQSDDEQYIIYNFFRF